MGDNGKNAIKIEVTVDENGRASAALKSLEADVNKFTGSVDKSGQSGLRLRDVFAGNLLADFFQRGTSAAVAFSAQAIQAAAVASDANRTLEASATQAGMTYAEAARKAEEFGRRVGLSNTEAARTYADLIRLAQQAGRPQDSGLIAKKFSDLAAARGVSAKELSTISQQIITGQDEGLNKLGLPDPSKLYAEYADKLSAVSGAAKRTADSLSQVEKANAAVSAVMEKSLLFDGAAETRMNSTAGRLDDLSAKYDNLTTALGSAITANGIYNDLLTGTLALVGQFTTAGQTQIQDAAKVADEAVESTAGKLTTRVRQTANLLYGAGAFLLKTIETGVSFASDLGKIDPVFGAQGLFGSEKFFQGTREGLRDLERISIEGKEAIYNAENRLREETIKEVEANNARLLQQELRAAEQKVNLTTEAAKRTAAQQIAAAESAAKGVARVEAEAAKSAADARKKVAADTLRDYEDLFRFVSQHAGKDNPFVAVFREAQAATDAFNQTAARLRETFGATADGLIDKFDALTKAKRAALAEDGVAQRFEDQLDALGYRQEAEALRHTPPTVTAKEVAETAKAEAVRAATPPASRPAAPTAPPTPSLAYFGAASPFAPKPELTDGQRAALAAYGDLTERQRRGVFVGNPAAALAGEFKVTDAQEQAEFLRSLQSGRYVGDFAAAYRLDTAASGESPAAQNAREAVELIRQLESEAVRGGLDATAAHRLANEQIIKRLRGAGGLESDPALREVLAGALDDKAGRVSSREQEAKQLMEEETKARREFMGALKSFTEQMKGFGINIKLDEGLTVNKAFLGEAPGAELNDGWGGWQP